MMIKLPIKMMRILNKQYHKDDILFTHNLCIFYRSFSIQTLIRYSASVHMMICSSPVYLASEYFCVGVSAVQPTDDNNMGALCLIIRNDSTQNSRVQNVNNDKSVYDCVINI